MLPDDAPNPPQANPAQEIAKLMTSLSGKDCPKFREKVIGLDESHPSVRTLSRWAESFVRKAALNDRTKGSTFMALSGPVGTGKTHVCRNVAAFLQSQAVNLLFTPGWAHSKRVPACKFSVWSRIAESGPLSFDDWMEEASESQWIVLDDVGSETDKYKSGEPVERLRRALDLARTRWMLVSTNVPRAKWPQCFDARVADRLLAAKCLDLSGVESYRRNGRV